MSTWQLCRFTLTLMVSGAATSSLAADVGDRRHPFENPQRIAWVWDGAAPAAGHGESLAPVYQHFFLRGSQVLTRRGSAMNALHGALSVTPVVHVDVSLVDPPVAIEEHGRLLVAALVEASHASNSGWVQLDFEAHPSQRLFYRDLVRDARAALPPNIRLSVTALAWWCRSGAWLDGLAADEVVPMFFRMGRDSDALRELVQDRPGLLHKRCRDGAAGFSVQEPLASTALDRYRRSYWFDSRRANRLSFVNEASRP